MPDGPNLLNDESVKDRQSLGQKLLALWRAIPILVVAMALFIAISALFLKNESFHDVFFSRSANWSPEPRTSAMVQALEDLGIPHVAWAILLDFGVQHATWPWQSADPVSVEIQQRLNRLLRVDAGADYERWNQLCSTTIKSAPSPLSAELHKESDAILDSPALGPSPITRSWSQRCRTCGTESMNGVRCLLAKMHSRRWFAGWSGRIARSGLARQAG